MRKMMTGFDCHWGEKARMFVLSESDEAIAERIDFRLTFQHLMQYLRIKTGELEYCCVIHRQGDKKRQNIHVVYFGSFIDQKIVDKFWEKHYHSKVRRFELVKYEEKTAYYLCKYVGGDEKFVKAQFSKNWVFPSWWAFGTWLKKKFGEYPSLDMLKEYSKFSKEALNNDDLYSTFKRDTKKEKRLSMDEWLKQLHEKMNIQGK